MKKQTVLLMSALLCGIFSFAQATYNLVVFSEQGEKFYVVLNGIRQNNAAQTNVKVTGLTSSGYSCKVIFEDTRNAEIDKKIYQPMEPMEMTYVIKRDAKSGLLVMKQHSFTPIPDQQVITPNQSVVVYSPTGTVTQQTTTTTTGGTVGASVNVGGLGVNVTIVDPLATQTTVTHTTTTTTTNSPPPPPPAPAGCAGAWPMPAGNFSSALSSISKQGFDETRLSTAKSIVNSNCVSAAQVQQICKTFGFEQTMLDFAKYAYLHCTDPNNYFVVNDVFGFSSSVDELNSYINSLH